LDTNQVIKSEKHIVKTSVDQRMFIVLKPHQLLSNVSGRWNRRPPSLWATTLSLPIN